MSESVSNRVHAVEDNSPAGLSDIRVLDEIVSINGNKISDGLDLAFYAQDETLDILLKRRGKIIGKLIEKDEGAPLGVEIEPFKIKTCKNRCQFCFVSQMPAGFRKTLYVKDEDFRLSFLYGNYITLSNLTEYDRQRIIEQRLSPLYISVHTTNNALRAKLMGNPALADINKEIHFFVKNKIKLHAQVVLCPGINDGAELDRTLGDLRKHYPFVMSVAVVPVGLTAFHKKKIQPVTKEDAQKALEIIESHQKKCIKKHGEPVIYGSDELYIKSGIKFPPLEHYGDLPQIENGVGMLPAFLHKASRFRSIKHPSKRKFITYTGVSFYPYLREFTLKLNKKTGIDIQAIQVENHVFGNTITVCGLLTGRDIVRSLIDQIKGDEILLIPDVSLKSGKSVFLDDITVEFISEALKVEVKTIESTFEGLISALGESTT
ncbi:MAG: DUF512 domain-containing protein [Nitrospirae bacterium]|nr:DUF512 domain-containing protein [Nitrospirota bacterium]MBF0535247.1 DUF512 domain-containing protein [Nitrospirota bacterium]MBF0615273.1 DUF512 domain-containing protein [Nitrospirota bacterium]